MDLVVYTRTLANGANRRAAFSMANRCHVITQQGLTYRGSIVIIDDPNLFSPDVGQL